MSSAPPERPVAGVSKAVRLDIQGLRAVAVLGVLLFHAGLPVSGGYVGVDVFFVISGFVITAMLLREWQRTGTIDLRVFYVRRFKRLTPALAVMVVVTLIVAFLLFSPFDQQVVTGQTGLGALFIVANWVIASNTGGYFDLAADANPLLHTWSLSVEEQFYVVFPSLLLVSSLIARRLPRAKWLPFAAVCAVALVSIVGVLYSLRSVEISSGVLLGFYSTITRAWEFAAGAIVALSADRIAFSSKPLARLLGIVGAILVVTSYFLFSGSTPWPSPLTLLPVVGTLLVIIAGMGPTTVVTHALSVRPMVAIGNLSYSLYLWHWPLIVFALAIWPLAPWVAVVAAAASVVPALLSYRWVEQPLRTSPIRTIRRLLPTIVAFVAVPALIASTMLWAAPHVLVPIYQSGKVTDVLHGTIDVDSYDSAVAKESYPCTPQAVFADAPRWNGFVRCRQSQTGEAVSVAILGDSHAEHLFPGFARALPDQNVGFYVDDFLPVRGTARMNRILDYLEGSTTVTTVIISVNWTGKGVQVAPLADTVSALMASGKRVFISDDNPTFGFGPFICKYREGLLLGKHCDMNAGPAVKVHADYLKQLDRVVAAAPGSHILSVYQDFCDERTCTMRRGNDVLFRDLNHLNQIGSSYVADSLLKDDAELSQGLGRMVAAK